MCGRLRPEDGEDLVRVGDPGFEEHASLGAWQFAEGKFVLLARLLETLIALIGIGLTLRLVVETWPKRLIAAT